MTAATTDFHHSVDELEQRLRATRGVDEVLAQYKKYRPGLAVRRHAGTGTSTNCSAFCGSRGTVRGKRDGQELLGTAIICSGTIESTICIFLPFLSFSFMFFHFRSFSSFFFIFLHFRHFLSFSFFFCHFLSFSFFFCQFLWWVLKIWFFFGPQFRDDFS